MYDDEEEILKKRKKLIYIIIAIVVLILILLIFLLTRGGGKKKTEQKMPECTLEVKEGIKDENDIYTSTTVIGFKEVKPASDKVPITKQTVGITDNSRNKETYTITKEGEFTVNGYVQDANGNTGTCTMTVKVNPTEPTCELEILEGTQGDNDWYVSDVVVGFKSKDSNSTIAKIEKYYIEVQKTNLVNGEIVKSDAPAENIDKFTLKDNGIVDLIGYVIDSNGKESTCKINVKKDVDVPTCTLKVNSGTQGSDGLYTTNVEVGLDKVEDQTSEIESKGIGIEKNYTEEVYTVTKDGETVVYGYVKDSAGNEGTCELSIKRPVPPPPKPQAVLSCELEVVGSQVGGKYATGAVVRFKSRNTTGTSPINAYGIDTTQKTNGKDSYEITKAGTTTLYGMVKDAEGNTGVCGPITVETLPLLSSKVKVGDLVNYDAGTWSATVEVPKEDDSSDGKFGGYIQGTSKNTSVKCRKEDTNVASGWKVFSVANGVVSLIHEGTPECYYHAAKNASAAVTNLNNESKVYMNDFAQSSRMMNIQDYNSTTEAFKKINNHYYLAGTVDSTSLGYVSYTGRYNGGSRRTNGVRPIIVLKNNIFTTDTMTNNAWPLYLGTTTKSVDEEREIETGNSFFEDMLNIINELFEEHQ